MTDIYKRMKSILDTCILLLFYFFDLKIQDKNEDTFFSKKSSSIISNGSIKLHRFHS